MLSAWEKHLPLVFHEDGFDAEYKIIRKDGHSDPNIIRDGTLKFISGKDERPTFRVESMVGADLGDVALYASFVAFRTHAIVDLTFNDVGLSIDGQNPGIDEDQMPGNLPDVITDRFKNISGTGSLTESDMLTIGQLCVTMEQAYYSR